MNGYRKKPNIYNLSIINKLYLFPNLLFNVLCAMYYDTFLLPQTDAPEVTLRLGSNLDENEIKEGDDVYFECNIKANPQEHKVTWMRNVSWKRERERGRIIDL